MHSKIMRTFHRTKAKVGKILGLPNEGTSLNPMRALKREKREFEKGAICNVKAEWKTKRLKGSLWGTL